MNENQHYAIVEKAGGVVQLVAGEETLLETGDALRLAEYHQGRQFPDVIYFPQTVVASLGLVQSNKTTHCPIKGDTLYWSYGERENCAWSYPDPLPGVAAIAGHVAFDTAQGFRVIRQT